MVSNLEKATAISRLKLGDTPLDISADLGLPTMLIKEWQDNLDMNDLVRLQANTQAVNRLITVTPPEDSSLLVAGLKNKIEEAAVEIIDHVGFAIRSGDPQYARALHLLASTCTTLYTTIVNKEAVPTGANTNITLFQQLRKD
jgi:hypothetical protein